MSSRSAVTWGTIVDICKARGIDILQGKGGEMKLKGPADDDGVIRVMRIGHQCCRSKNSNVYIDYVKKFQRTYGIPDEEIWG